MFLSHGAALFAWVALPAYAVLLWRRARGGEISRLRGWLLQVGVAVLVVAVQMAAIRVQVHLPRPWRLSGETTMYTGFLFLGVVALAVVVTVLFGAVLLLSRTRRFPGNGSQQRLDWRCRAQQSAPAGGEGDGSPGEGDGPPGEGDGPPGEGNGPPGEGDDPLDEGDGPPGEGDGSPGEGDGSAERTEISYVFTANTAGNTFRKAPESEKAFQGVNPGRPGESPGFRSS